MAENSLFKSIMTGLNEAIDDASGKKPALKRRTYVIEPVKEYFPEDIKRIRNSTGLSQKAFAGYMGVSVKTVEAWEAGTNKPSGAAARILMMIEQDKEFITRFPFVKMLVK
jgi:putative transcriptional regulator